MSDSLSLFQIVLENSSREDKHECPFGRSSIELTKMLCEILKVGELRKSLLVLTTLPSTPAWCHVIASLLDHSVLIGSYSLATKRTETGRDYLKLSNNKRLFCFLLLL